MRPIKFSSVLVFLLIALISGNATVRASDSVINIREKFIFTGDTVQVNKYARRVLALTAKKVELKDIKAYIDTAEMICKKENIEMPAILHLARAEYFFLNANFNDASQEALIAMKLAKSSDETRTLAKTMLFLGKYSLRTGFFKESLEYYNNLITLAKKEKLKEYIPLGYRSLAGVYHEMGSTRQYNNNLQKLITAATSENDTMFLRFGYYFLGTSLTGENRNYRKADSLEYKQNIVPDSLVFRDFRKADSLLRKGLALSQKKKDSVLISLTYANLGWNFYREKKYEDAIREYNKSLIYSIATKRHDYTANAYGNLGTIYRDKGNTELSLKYYHKSIEEAKIQNDLYSLFWVYLDMSDMYLNKGDTSKAFTTYVLYKKFNDLFLKRTNNQGLADAKIRYDAETHNKELQLLSLRVSNQRLLIYGFTVLFILCIAVGVLLFSRSKIDAKRRLSEMNRKIAEVTQANLRQQMNPHFIFNTLNSIQYYMYQHDKLATNNYLTKFASLMRKVLENSQHTAIPLRDELEALNLYLELELIRFKDKFDYEIKVDEEIDPILYKVPTMLIQPYVENSISHGLMPHEGKGMVKIVLRLEKEFILCSIEDNGIGREAAQEIKRRKENNHSSLGTQIVSSRLDLVNALYGTSLKTTYTDLKNKNDEPEGTRVEIQIPILT
jgi:tetratricopeptide (TPR) repeat protein